MIFYFFPAATNTTPTASPPSNGITPDMLVEQGGTNPNASGDDGLLIQRDEPGLPGPSERDTLASDPGNDRPGASSPGYGFTLLTDRFAGLFVGTRLEEPARWASAVGRATDIPRQVSGAVIMARESKSTEPLTSTLSVVNPAGLVGDYNADRERGLSRVGAAAQSLGRNTFVVSAVWGLVEAGTGREVGGRRHGRLLEAEEIQNRWSGGVVTIVLTGAAVGAGAAARPSNAPTPVRPPAATEPAVTRPPATPAEPAPPRPAEPAPPQPRPPRTAVQIVVDLPPERTLAETSPVRIPGRPIRPQDRIIPGTNRLRPLQPGEVEIRVTTRGGNESGGRPYTNFEYRWRGEDGALYNARFHDPTGNSPAGSNPSWVVERTFPGDGITGSPTEHPRTQFYSGNDWVSAAEWHAAIVAYRNGTATTAQLNILRQGHVEVP